jgi:hypothetical protein
MAAALSLDSIWTSVVRYPVTKSEWVPPLHMGAPGRLQDPQEPDPRDRVQHPADTAQARDSPTHKAPAQDPAQNPADTDVVQDSPAHTAPAQDPAQNPADTDVVQDRAREARVPALLIRLQ